MTDQTRVNKQSVTTMTSVVDSEIYVDMNAYTTLMTRQPRAQFPTNQQHFICVARNTWANTFPSVIAMRCFDLSVVVCQICGTANRGWLTRHCARRSRPATRLRYARGRMLPAPLSACPRCAQEQQLWV